MDLPRWEDLPEELLDPARLWLNDNDDGHLVDWRDPDEVADRRPLASDLTPPEHHPATVPEPPGPECPKLAFPVRDFTRLGDLPGSVRERAREYQEATRRDPPPEDWPEAGNSSRAMRQPSAMTFHRLLAHFVLADPTAEDHVERNGFLQELLAPKDGQGSALEQWGESAEFGLLGLQRLLFLFARETETLEWGQVVPMVDCELQSQAVRQMLGFKYFGDDLAVYPQDPHPEVYWSENHQIGYAVAEYLAGQMLPDAEFEPRARYGSAYWVTELPPGQVPRPVELGTATHPVRRLSGLERMERAYPRIVHWLDHRLMFGFSEWNSPVYYEYDTAALLNLVDFCDQRHLMDKAAMVLDLLILDMARLSGEGQAGSSAGRAYTSHKLTSWRASSCNTLQILFGNWEVDPQCVEVVDRWRLQNIQERAKEKGEQPSAKDLQPFVPCTSPWLNADSVGAHSLATTEWYGLPGLLGTWSIIPSRSPEVPRFERSRVSVGIDEGGSVYDIGTSTDQEVLDWWSRGGFGLSELIVQSRDLAAKWQLWNVSPFSEMVGLFVLPNAVLRTAADALSAEGRGSFLGTTNLALWREKGVSLSSAQKFNVATVGRQAQIWQATLGPYVSVFSTYPAPASSESDSDGPSWWAGNASQPRVVQYEDALICIHDSTLLSYTNFMYGHRSHAWFPVEMFHEAYQYHRDEEDDDFTFILNLKTGDHRREPIGIQAEQGGTWWFGRRDDSYIGLFSAKDSTRLLRTGRWADREILCEDRVNVFICQVGSDDRFGTLDRFMQHCVGARIHIGKGVYQPSNPLVDIYAGYDIPDPTKNPGTSKGRLSLNAEVRFPSFRDRPFSDESFPRWETPWGKVRWGEVDYTLACTDAWGDGNIWLRHDTVSGMRTGTDLT